MTANRIQWPEGRDFAFTVFDDTDLETLENGPPVYDFLLDHGFRTTKSVWPLAPGSAADHPPRTLFDGKIDGGTCDEPDYLEWVLQLQRDGFEIAFHNATYITSRREFTLRALDRFREHFGADPRTYTTHFQCLEGMYWGSSRVSGVNRLVYNILNRFRTHDAFHGQTEGSDLFWGDLCRERIDYVRNFVYGEINTLKMCPVMPYFDPDRKYVKGWYASSEGPDVESFSRTISEANQDRLEAEGGACIMYTHFAKGFWDGSRIEPRFEKLMRRLASRNGWFVPVSTLLDHVRQQNGLHRLTASERGRLERRWLLHKIRVGGSS